MKPKFSYFSLVLTPSIRMLTLLVLLLGQSLHAMDRVQEEVLLKRSTHSVWFDAETGKVKPTPARVDSIDVSDRHASIATPANPYNSSWLDRLRSAISDFFSFLFQGWRIIFIGFLLLLLGIMVSVIFRYGREWFGLEQPANRKNVRSKERERAKIQDLPFEIEHSNIGLLAQAEKFRAAGDYSRAIVYLFSHALVEMDGARCIRLERGKTNRNYLRELNGRDNLRGFTTQLVIAFEFAFFGKHRLSQDSFEAIWKQIPSFEVSLKQLNSVSSPARDNS